MVVGTAADAAGPNGTAKTPATRSSTASSSCTTSTSSGSSTIGGGILIPLGYHTLGPFPSFVALLTLLHIYFHGLTPQHPGHIIDCLALFFFFFSLLLVVVTSHAHSIIFQLFQLYLAKHGLLVALLSSRLQAYSCNFRLNQQII